jgi:cytochrome d ubiquinol oxidase subunit I
MNELQAQYEQTYGPGDYIPPVRTTFWSFRIMVLAGTLMILLSLYGTILAKRNKLDNKNTWFYRFMLWSISLPFIANTAGWVMTEFGRQPWTVFGLMQTKDSVSPSVSSGQMLFSIIAFTLIFTVLAISLVYLFLKVIKQGPYAEGTNDNHSIDPFSKEGYHVS